MAISYMVENTAACSTPSCFPACVAALSSTPLTPRSTTFIGNESTVSDKTASLTPAACIDGFIRFPTGSSRHTAIDRQAAAYVRTQCWYCHCLYEGLQAGEGAVEADCERPVCGMLQVPQLPSVPVSCTTTLVC